MKRAIQRVLISAAAALGFLVAAAVPVGPSDPGVALAQPDPLDGIATGCTDFQLYLGLFSVDIPDPGWAWVNPAEPFQSATGVALKSEITHTDFPVVHDSHDINVDILLDPGQEGLLSIVNPDKAAPVGPDTLEVEWEIGTHPSETGSDPERTLPKWAWPNKGDRVWTNGHHIYDCGHTTEVDSIERARSEIHPARAMASMRDQMGTIPGTGSTPVRTTTTDLWIHGRAGFVTDVLYCGAAIVIQDTDPDFACPTNETPIDDDYEFDVQLPSKPSSSAVLAWSVEDGPRNNLSAAPIIVPVPAVNPTSLHVTIPLDGSGAAPSDVYSRTIKAGWVYPPDGLRHFNLTLNRMDLHEDMDLDPGDCECTFFWMNVDRAPSEWIRLSTFANGNMNDYDDDGGLLGDGEISFSGASFDYYVADGMSVNVSAHGYDQDCLDDYFGDHRFQVGIFLDCYLAAALELEAGDNDDYNVLNAAFGGPDYGVGAQDVSAGGQYELEFSIEEIPVDLEDDADLQLTKICKPDNVAFAGQEVTCTILVNNPGPGLPRNVVVEDTLLTNVAPSNYALQTPTFVFEGFAGSPNPCDAPTSIPGGKQFTCNLGTVPVGGSAIITAKFTSSEGGDFNNRALVTTDSTDANTANNESIDGLTIVPVADLALTKSDAPDPLNAGTIITYQLGVTNNGPSTAVNVVVEDFLPAGVSLLSVSGSGGASCLFGIPGDNARPTSCNFNSLASGAARTMTIQVAVGPGVLLVAHNDARVSSGTADLNNSNDVASTDTTIAVADIGVSLTSNADLYKSSSTIKYTITVANSGPGNAAGVVVQQALPTTKGTSYSFDSGGCTRSGTTLTCAMGSMGAGETRSFNVYVLVKGSKGQITSIATAATTTFDPVLVNNGSTRNVLVGK
ncbi:MAG: DUF11 domain-containing protein [Dehalococcoidia bacterium]